MANSQEEVRAYSVDSENKKDELMEKALLNFLILACTYMERRDPGIAHISSRAKESLYELLAMVMPL